MTKRIILAALSCISFVYALVTYRVGSGTFSFFIWIFATLFFAFLWFMAGKDRWNKVPVWIKKIYNLLLTMGLVIFLFCQGCILSQFFAKGESGADYIVVLGAQMKDWGPSIVYKHRLDAAADYLERNPETKVIVTGGQGFNESISEGEGGKIYLVEQGVAEDRIIVEDKSTDTDLNIKNAFSLVPEKNLDDLKIGIVTNNFHVFRGTMIARKYTDAQVFGLAAHTEYLYLPNNMVRETFGILKDLL